MDVLAPFGVQVDWPTFARHCVGLADRRTVDFLARFASPPVDSSILWEQYPNKKTRFQELARSGPLFVPAVIEMIESLGRYKLAVVTSSARAEVEPLLAMGGIRDRFGAVVCGDDVESLKPAPDPYLLAARLLGVTRALVVEDSAAGVASGRAAGFDTLEVGRAEETPVRLAAKLARVGYGG